MSSALGLILAPRNLFGLLDGKLLPISESAQAASAATQKKLVTMYFPNGCAAEFWNLQHSLGPLRALHDQGKVLLLQNVRNPLSNDSPRDPHEEGGASLFTGQSLVDGARGGGASLDQIVSPTWNKDTPLGEPLVCAVWRGFAGGSFRSTSWSRRSWLASGHPANPIQDPIDTYKTMLGLSSNSRIDLWRKSALDSVIQRYSEFSSATSKLSTSDKSIVNSHMESLREIEKSAANFSNIAQECKTVKEKGPTFQGIPPDTSGLLPYASFQRAYRLHMDLVALALSCGITRSASLGFGCAGEEFIEPSISPSLPDHASSHYDSEPTKAIYLAYRRFHLDNVRYFAEKLRSHSILDSTLVIAGSEFADGRTHEKQPQPHVIVGGGDFVSSGSVDVAGRSNNDLYRTLLQAGGVTLENVGNKKYNTPGEIKGIIK